MTSAFPPSEPARASAGPAAVPAATARVCSRFRKWRLALLVLGVALALVAWRIWQVQGWLRAVRVSSGSLAPFLLGPHTEATCADCGYTFRYGHEHPPLAGLPVCPNCGFFGPAASEHPWPGQALLIDRAGFWFQAPERWQVVALTAPPHGRLTVKRIVALPGEKVALAHGELYVNGELVRKSYPVFQQLAWPVYCGTGNRSLEMQRWRAAPRGAEEWTREGEAWNFAPAQASEPGQAGLEYHHWPCTGPPGERFRESPVLDLDAYNQGLSRGLNEVFEFALRCRVNLSEKAQLTLRLPDGEGPRGLRLSRNDAGAYRMQVVPEPRDAPREFAPVEIMAEPPEGALACEFAIIDRQIFLAAKGRLVLQVALPPLAANALLPPAAAKAPAEALAHSLPAVFASGGRLQLSGLEIWRDVYWLCPDGTGRSWQAEQPLGPDEYFVLGDNTAASEDSRHWPAGSVRRGTLRGPAWRRP